MGKEEQDLIIGVGVTRGSQVQIAYTHLNAGEFRAWLGDVAQAVPAHQTWFAKCWDQVLLEVLVEGDLKFILAAHECVGRARAKEMLRHLRRDVGQGLSGSRLAQAEGMLRALACSLKGVVPPRKVLVLYEGAPKKFLTKEDQAPELLEAGGKSRLQKALEAADEEDDAFTFTLDRARREAEDAENEDQFTFNFPPKAGEQAESTPKPNGLIFTSHFAPGTAAQGSNSGMLGRPLAKSLSKKFPSPGRSGDFTWNGVRVSPDDSEHIRRQQQLGGAGGGSHHKPLANAFHSTIHAFRGRGLFSGQFEKDGGGRQAEAKVKGAVGDIAPSGLSWEDEIASQLAAAGVRVSKTGEEGGDADDDVRGALAASASLKSPVGTAAQKRFPIPNLAKTGSAHHSSLFSNSSASQLRSASIGRGPERGLGLGRLARGFRKTFRQSADDDSA